MKRHLLDCNDCPYRDRQDFDGLPCRNLFQFQQARCQRQFTETSFDADFLIGSNTDLRWIGGTLNQSSN